MVIARFLLVVVRAEVAESKTARSGFALGFGYAVALGAGTVAVIDAIYGMFARLIEGVKVINSGHGDTQSFSPRRNISRVAFRNANELIGKLGKSHRSRSGRVDGYQRTASAKANWAIAIASLRSRSRPVFLRVSETQEPCGSRDLERLPETCWNESPLRGST